LADVLFSETHTILYVRSQALKRQDSGNSVKGKTDKTQQQAVTFRM